MNDFTLTGSKELHDRARECEPGGFGANNRGHAYGFSPYPISMVRGTGAYLEDVDGNTYLDYIGAWGPLILGHRPRKVLDAVHKTLEEVGSTLGFGTRLEIEAAEAIVQTVPSWEQVRFANSGSEAVMAALRMARAYTGRQLVLRFEGHFHGWPDLTYFSTAPALSEAGPDSRPCPVPDSAGMVAAVAESLVIRQWNDLDALEETFREFGDDLAAVICEPVLTSASVIPTEPGYLERLRTLTSRHGVVLIFDEVKTGFRVALGGAQELLGVLPDLSVAGKAMGAGFPVAAVGGRKELFDPVAAGVVWQSSTYQANTMALAAVLATLQEVRAPGFYEALTSRTDRLAKGLTAAAGEAGCTGYARAVGSILQFVFADTRIRNYRDFVRHNDAEKFHELWTGLLQGGVMIQPHQTGWFVSAAHSDSDIERTITVARDVMSGIEP